MKVTKLKKLNIFAAVALVLCLVLSFAPACSLFGEKGATYVRLDKDELTLYVGETAMLSAQTDGFGKRWSSDDEDVATVDDGEVTAVAPGVATITVKVDKVKAYCDVTVLEREPEEEPDDGNGETDPDDPNNPGGETDPDDPKDDPKEEDPKEDPEEKDPVEPEDPYPVKSGNIKDIYEDYFVIGAAVQSGKLTNNGYGTLMSHFNSLSPENNMKWKNIESSEGNYNFNQSGDSADRLISWAKSNGVGVRGHCLIWYKSLPEWLHEKFVGKSYSESLKTSAYNYIDNHIEKVMEHFGDGVYVWDVVNESLFNSVNSDQLTTSANQPYGNIWRTNDNMSATDSDWVDWYKVTGGYEYVAHAFKKAAQVRSDKDLEVELYYNDYGLNDPAKRQACLNLIKMLKDNDAPVDGIGMQAHYKLDDYTADRDGWIKNFEASVKAFIEAGVDVQITELDIRWDGELTEQREADQAEMYGKIFEVARKYAKTQGKEHGITGVTVWGVYDGCNGAWGTDKYPLVFGTDKQPKKAYYEIINFRENLTKNVNYILTVRCDMADTEEKKLPYFQIAPSRTVN